jgi:hypothetical protein
MRHLRSRPLTLPVALGCLLFAGSAHPLPQTSTQLPVGNVGHFRIAGTIVSASEGHPLSRARVSLPLSSNLPPHTFVYSTQSGTGYGLGPRNNGWAAWGAESGRPVPGNIEKDFPYDPSGKLKPNYQCSKISDDKCFEDCVNQKSLDATRNPPSYQLGSYQCDTWANNIERQCRQQCKKK